MGRRTEHRIAANLPIVVRGVDHHGNPFTQTARTCDVSASGARLEGLECIEHPGGKIEIEFQGKKAWFHVQWVGQENTSHSGQIGVRSLEPGKYVWGVKLSESVPDEYDPADPDLAVPTPPTEPVSVSAPVPWAGGERRQFPRRACRIDAQVTVVGSSMGLPARVTDICLGGCYVEMMSPLPVGSAVDLRLDLGAEVLQSRGKVRSSHPGMGMGISFTGMSPEDLQKLRQIAPPSPGQQEPPFVSPPPPALHGPEPAAKPTPKQATTTAEALEAVVRVLFRKGILERSELEQEIERLKVKRT